ncbi:MAG: class I SAM-dependent methyltransferase [Chlamydiia bacterium]|nr:class I SAM-dependent methyltransferase [Chlamydiia bacterium]
MKMPSSPPVDNFRKLEDDELSLPHFPMDLYMCKKCGHAQLLDVVSPDILYGNYIYTSSSSPDLDAHFTAYASHVAKQLKLAKGAHVLDVGSNDGLLLSKFKNLGFQVLGVDPSQYVASLAKASGIHTEVGFLNASLANKISEKYGKMDLVTANNVFSHADDLRGFALSVHALLKDTGTFVFEVSYLKDTVENLVLDYIYHEHLCYHSILPLQQFMQSCDLKLIDVERIATKGGSIRCYAIKATNPIAPSPTVEKMIAEEKKSGLYDAETYAKLEKKIDAIRSQLQEKIQQELAQGHRIAAYGASATSTVLNAMLGISDQISFIVDDNPLRQKRLSPGYFTPVLASDSLLKYQPSLTIISAWRFADAIMKKNQAYKNAGGKFLIPLPNLRVE